MKFSRIQLIALSLAIVSLAACGGQPSPTAARTSAPTPLPPFNFVLTDPTAASVAPTATPASSIPNFGHVFIIVLENKEAVSIVGNPNAPYFNSLAGRYARATAFYGTRHPSLPNYLALIGGSTFSISTDCTGCYIAEEDNLVTQLETAGRTWKAYMEAMPSPCYVGNAGPLYMQKHNPFIYFDNIRNNPERCNNIVPFTQFETDLEAGALPKFVWITPDMCNSMHDCDINTGNNWLEKWVSKILEAPEWKDNGVLFITFDEGKSDAGCCQYAAGGQIDTLVVSPLVHPGFVSDVKYDHYSLLRTIEEAWGMPLLRKADCECTPNMKEFFTMP